MLNLSEVPTAKNRELVETYNELTGKSVKGFGSRAAGVKAVTKQLLLAASKNGEQPAASNGEHQAAAPQVARKARRPYKRVAAAPKAAPIQRATNWREQLLEELLQDPDIIKKVAIRILSKS